MVSDNRTKVKINDETYSVKLREKCNRKIVSESRWNHTELVLNGTLSLKLDHVYETKEWKDGRLPLEKQLTRIVAALEIRAEDDRKKKIKWEGARKEQERVRAIEERLKAEREWEDKKVEILLSHAAKWRQARDVGQFIAAVENYSIEQPEIADIAEWVDWAKCARKSVDPLSRGIKKLLEQYAFRYEKVKSQ